MSGDRQRAVCDYLRRSYEVVDGLWFVLAEKRFGYSAAWELDRQVWEKLPRIQARKAREVLRLSGHGVQQLAQALALKFEAEGYETTIDQHGARRIIVRVEYCPWLHLLKKSGRTHIPIEDICRLELDAWATAFDPGLVAAFRHARCRSDSQCEITIEREPVPPS